MQKISLNCLALSFLAGLSLAQEPPLDSELLEEEVPEIRRYTVELIVFRYAEEVSVGTEVFEPEIIEPEIVEAEALEAVMPEELSLLDEAIDEEAIVEAEEEEEVRFEMLLLAEDELTLIDTYERLDRLDAYEPLLHVGWTQTALPEDETPALDLREFGEPPADLHGSFSLYLSRYLHLVVDLELDAENEAGLAYDEPMFEEPMFDEPLFYEPMYDESTYGELNHDEPTYAPLTYAIDENRLFKNGETRYFDHPKFGVVAKVLRYEEPEVEEMPDDTEFLSPAVVGDQGR